MKVIHVWLIDIYQSSPNGLENNIPNLSWADAMRSAFPPRSFNGSIDELRFNLGKHVEISLDRNGIRLKKHCVIQVHILLSISESIHMMVRALR